MNADPAHPKIAWMPWVRAGLILAAVVWSGCATDPAPPGSRHTVSTATAQLYRNGPVQDTSFQTEALRVGLPYSSGPDVQLPKGATVTMVKREFGYSRVRTDEGVTGYVANDQLRPAATAAVVPARNLPTPVEKPTLRRPGRSAPAPAREDRLDMSDLDLPLPI